MKITTDNAHKFLGYVLWQRMLGKHIRRIRIIKYLDGSGRYAYQTVDNVCADVPEPNSIHTLDVIKVEDCPEITRDFDNLPGIVD